MEERGGHDRTNGIPEVAGRGIYSILELLELKYERMSLRLGTFSSP
jgi:hypothetical protein